MIDRAYVWVNFIFALAGAAAGVGSALVAARFTSSKTRASRAALSAVLSGAAWLSVAAVFAAEGIAVCVLLAVALSLLCTMAQTDAKKLFIPDTLQVAYFACAAALAVLRGGAAVRLGGFLFCGGLFLSVYLLSFPLFRREGLGFGDVKLMASSGLLLGFASSVVAAVLGVFYALADCARKRLFSPHAAFPLSVRSEEFPFAPYLATAVAFSLVFGERLASLYLSLFLL